MHRHATRHATRNLRTTHRKPTAPLALVATTILVLTATPAQTGQYVLEKGKGVEVCEAYEKNLNSFKPRQPFRCDRPINPELTDFAKPIFRGPESLPAERVVPGGVIKQVERFLWERDVNPVYWYRGGIAKWRGTPEQYEQAWRSFKDDREIIYMNRWKIAEIDIDNDNFPETVYRDGQCSPGAILLVVNKGMTDIDRAKTELVMPHPSREAQGLGELRKLAPGERAGAEAEKFGFAPVEDPLHGAGYDIFQYKNKTYFDLWWYSHPDYQSKLDFLVGKPLRVFMIKSNQTREICTYKYQHTD
jgi:hypothetical protein